MKQAPDHHDAKIVLELYELRREAVMRESRKTMLAFLPRSYEDLLALTVSTHPANAAYRQVASYWEMAYSFARHGVVHPDFLVENGGEGLILYVKVEPYLERLREELSPLAFRNAEWIATQCESGRRLHGLFQARVRKLIEAAG